MKAAGQKAGLGLTCDPGDAGAGTGVSLGILLATLSSLKGELWVQ